MARSLLSVATAAILAGSASARAGSVDIRIAESHGASAANAVVALSPLDSGAAPVTRLPSEAVIDQRKETFIPLVTIVRTGGHVVFTNHDTTMHQVYSFSPIKQFEFEIDQGQQSRPVVFEKPGVAAIGCNIHDQMITYVYVAASPWAALTDAQGHARIADVPSGRYRVELWHPQLAPGEPPPSATIDVRGETEFRTTVSLLPPPAKHMHMGSY
jgi:plastocyanin